MSNFWDYSVWGSINIVAVLLISLIVANMLKRSFKFIGNSLIPTSVLAGLILLVISSVYTAITDELLFNQEFFGGNGMNVLEVLTYHSLALGFIALSLKTSDKKLNKKRATEVFNTGVTTVNTYLIQAFLGMGITMLLALVVKELFSVAGILLPFGFGQGTGQALNYGNIYETDWGFVGGKNFGLTVAALGFLSASIGGIIHLNILKKKGKFQSKEQSIEVLSNHDIQESNEIPMNGEMDKLTIQLAFVVIAYLLTYGVMALLGTLLKGMRAVIFGFNFLIGVLMATLIRWILAKLNQKQIIHRKYTNNFLLTRIGNFFFDIMVVAGIAVIRLDLLKNYWFVLLILAVVGAVATYFYNRFIARKMFKEYSEEQFLAMYGMLTGTASTGMILLREIDPDYKTPVADNMVYQQFPAIVFGLPIMLLANLAPKRPVLTLILVVVLLIVMHVILFRDKIFKTKSKEENAVEN